MPRRRAGLLLVIAVFAAVLLLFPVLSGFLTDWWWFKEIGYQVVFTRELVTRALLFLAAGGLTFGVLYGNLRLAQRGLVPNPIVLQLGESALPVNVTAALRRFSLPVSLGARTPGRTGGGPGLEPGAPDDLPDAVRHHRPGIFPRHRILRLHAARPHGPARIPLGARHHLAAAPPPGLLAPR